MTLFPIMFTATVWAQLYPAIDLKPLLNTNRILQKCSLKMFLAFKTGVKHIQITVFNGVHMRISYCCAPQIFVSSVVPALGPIGKL